MRSLNSPQRVVEPAIHMGSPEHSELRTGFDQAEGALEDGTFNMWDLMLSLGRLHQN